MVDTARRKLLPLLPINPVDADQPAASHDLRPHATVWQMMAQELRRALCQSRDRLPPRGDGLAGRPTAQSHTCADGVSQPLSARSPLIRTLPDSPDTRWDALSVDCVVSRIDDEAARIASDHTLAGLAWALGVQHPRIRAVDE